MDAAVIVLLLVVAEIPVEQPGPPAGNRITDGGLAA